MRQTMWRWIAAAVLFGVGAVFAGFAWGQDNTGTSSGGSTDPSTTEPAPDTTPDLVPNYTDVILRDECGERDLAESLDRLKTDRRTMRNLERGHPLRLLYVYTIRFEEKQADGSMKKVYYSPSELQENFDLQVGAGVSSEITGAYKGVSQTWITIGDPNEMLLASEPMLIGGLHKKGLGIIRVHPDLGVPGNVLCVLAEQDALDDLIAIVRGERIFTLGWKYDLPDQE